MPYIVNEKRRTLDPAIDALHAELIGLEMDDEQNNTEGNINYIITKLVMLVYGTSDATQYSQLNDAIGVLECVKQEFYRKVAAPYEDQKEFDNGAIEVGTFSEVMDPINVVADHPTKTHPHTEDEVEYGDGG